jgi:polyhydroxyalkanoate synthesis regulator phasin
MPPKKNATPAKQLEDSSVTFDESEDMSFRVSRVEGLVKGLVSKGELDQSINKLRGDLVKNMKGDLDNLQVEMKESIGNMEKKLETNMENMKKLEENMETIIKLIQHPEEKLPNDDNVDQGTHDERRV